MFFVHNTSGEGYPNNYKQSYRSKYHFNYAIFFFCVILSLNFPAFAQTNIDSISGRFQQLSKQLADLEKYVYNNGGEGASVISSGQQKRIDAFDEIEDKLDDLKKLLRQAKIATVKYYRQDEPKSYSVVYGTDLIKDYIKDIETLLLDN